MLNSIWSCLPFIFDTFKWGSHSSFCHIFNELSPQPPFWPHITLGTIVVASNLEHLDHHEPVSFWARVKTSSLDRYTTTAILSSSICKGNSHGQSYFKKYINDIILRNSKGRGKWLWWEGPRAAAAVQGSLQNQKKQSIHHFKHENSRRFSSSLSFSPASLVQSFRFWPSLLDQGKKFVVSFLICLILDNEALVGRSSDRM